LIELIDRLDTYKITRSFMCTDYKHLKRILKAKEEPIGEALSFVLNRKMRFSLPHIHKAFCNTQSKVSIYRGEKLPHVMLIRNSEGLTVVESL